MNNQIPILHDNSVDYSPITQCFFQVLDIVTDGKSRTYVLKMMDGSCNIQRLQVAESQIETIFSNENVGIGDYISFQTESEDNIPRCRILQRKGRPVSPDTVTSIRVIEDAIGCCGMPEDLHNKVMKALQTIKNSTGYSLLEYMLGPRPGDRSLKDPCPPAT